MTKTSIMLGCGERPEEVSEALRLLRAAGAPCFQIYKWIAGNLTGCLCAQQPL